ncbi:MAG TPA: hypothetical protein VFF68_01190, partial [Anaerolineaceae bacterium]|nr:hypothetical protein [Anaerolineaceae bacterium]
MTTVPESTTDQDHVQTVHGQKPRSRIGAWVGAAARGLALGKSGWDGATLGLTAAGVLAGAFFLAGIVRSGAPNWFAAAAFVVLIGLTVALANLIGTVLLPALARLVLHLPARFRWALLGAFILAFLSFIGWGDLAGPIVVAAWAALAAAAGAGAGALLGSGWRALRPLQRGSAVFLLALGAAGLGAGLVYLLSPGAAYAPPPAPAAGEGVAAIDLPDPAQAGPHAVETLTYGSGTDRHRPEYGAQVDWVTESVDGSALIDGWTGLAKLGRDLYWGFDARALPLNGRVWTPKGAGPFPLALIVHGNHSAEDFSDPGYAYLGELLASRGIITVSVDENFLNGAASDGITGPGSGLKGENDARAWLLLEHLRQWRAWNQQPGHLFSGRVDLDNIALIGHSRGGEAVTVASVFNRLPAYPDNARIP